MVLPVSDGDPLTLLEFCNEVFVPNQIACVRIDDPSGATDKVLSPSGWEELKMLEARTR